ncbi:MAG: ribosome maturation factor RimP, partial [Actinobacteria bacterium]|nr:ribosome maturation factor RimP [Actinomycetota bacterium]
MATRDTLLALVTPIVAEVGAELYDLEYTGGVLKITVTQAGGIDLDTIGEITKQVSRQLDLDEPITSRYTLEVSSPGLERTLRLPEHWGGAVGEQVRVKLKPHVQGERRLVGTVVSATDSQATMEVDGATVVIDIDEVDRARTVYV